MQNDLKQALIEVFDERVAFHKTERLLYSTDIGFLPVIARMQINTMPDAVVQPRTKDELKKLVDLAARYKIPLVPRGGGTTGYGGAIPANGGMVVDFTRMNKVLSVDEAELAVTVEPGIRWNDLENELHKYKLSLRLYPGSAISATVGGWIAGGGGVGIGSYEFGYLADNIVSVDMVTPGGIKALSGKDIGLVDGLAGTTGFISGVTLKVRALDNDIPVLAAFDTLDDLSGLFNSLSTEKLELWEAGFRNPLHASLSIKAEKKQADQFISHQHEDENKQGLPENKFLALFVYPQGRESRVRGLLLKLIEAHQGQVLAPELARHEWDERFFPLRLKALGPSVIPSEVNIKAVNLPQFIKNIEKGMKGLAYNGTLINRASRSTVLTYMLGDERAPGFTLGYVNGFVPLKAAAGLEGRPYAIGMYLADRAADYWGKEKLLDLYKFKKQVDPGSIMNPGKVFPGSLDKTAPSRLRWMLKMAGSMSSIIGLAYKVLGSKSPARFAKPGNAIGKLPFGKQAAWDAFACVRCGYCSSVCTEYNALGWESASPRGKFHFLREYAEGHVKFDERMGELFYACTTCGHCNELCQIKSHIEEHWTLSGRPAAWADGYNPPQVSQVAASHALLRHNPAGMSQEKRTGWKAPGLKYSDQGEIGYWVGCNASFNQETRNLPVNSVRILNKAGIEPVYLAGDEWCCGGGIYSAGCINEIEDTFKHNMEELHKRGIKTLITSCGSCYYYLGHLYPILARQYGIEYNIKVRHITDFIDELIRQDKIKLKFPLKFSVTYHDPCHVACAGGVVDAPRRILGAIPELKVIEMPHHGAGTACCGRHTSRYPNYGSAVISKRLDEAFETSVPALVTGCPTCETNFRNTLKYSGRPMEVFDITDIVAESMGLPTLVGTKIKKILKGPGEAGEKPEAPKIFLSEEELAKEKNLFSPHNETYGALKQRKGSIKTISEKLGESTDNTSVPKSC
jgi:Fe-S oxidoreductase/FAD/FMN-containing dehydrogenase